MASRRKICRDDYDTDLDSPQDYDVEPPLRSAPPTKCGKDALPWHQGLTARERSIVGCDCPLSEEFQHSPLSEDLQYSPPKQKQASVSARFREYIKHGAYIQQLRGIACVVNAWQRRFKSILILTGLLSLYLSINLQAYNQRTAPALEKYSPDCKPYFLYYKSDDLNPVLGLPPRLFPSWSVPEPVVRAQIRNLNRCWHPDKAQRHCRQPNRLNGRVKCKVDKAHMDDIANLYLDVQHEYRLRNATITGTMAVLGLTSIFDKDWAQINEQLRNFLEAHGDDLSDVDLGAFQYDATVAPPALPPPFLNSTLPHLHPSCKCTAGYLLHSSLKHAVTPFFLHDALFPLPKSDYELADTCLCFDSLAHTLKAYLSPPPRKHPQWGDPHLHSSKNPFFILYRIYGMGFTLKASVADYDIGTVSRATQDTWLATGYAEARDVQYTRREYQDEMFREQERETDRKKTKIEWASCLVQFQDMGLSAEETGMLCGQLDDDGNRAPYGDRAACVVLCHRLGLSAEETGMLCGELDDDRNVVPHGDMAT